MCGVVGIKDSPYYYNILFFICQQERKECGLQGSGSPQKAFFLLFVNKRRNEENNDGGDGDIGLYWMGPGAPTLANC